MTTLSYIRANPSGNITLLVLTPVPRDRQAAVAAAMMKAISSEQVGFLEAAGDPAALCRLQMMGGEFCGNAAMSVAALTAREKGIGPGETITVPLEVSGADGVLTCRIIRCDGCYEGTVRMPQVLKTEETALGTLVHLDGIAHLIVTEPIGRTRAEAILRTLAGTLKEEACGLLQWVDGFMTPLVYVKGPDSMVWETACGSGTTAIGAMEAMKRGNGRTVTVVRQPGGALKVETAILDGHVTEAILTGKVTLEEENTFRY